jgi:hypothetical protein
MEAKIFQKKDNNEPSSFETEIKLRDSKTIKASLTSFTYNDFDPDMDDYEEKEILVKKSDVKFKVKESKGKLKIILEFVDIEFDIDDEAQSERFMDKDWETETIIPTLKLTDKSKKEEYVSYDGGHLFTLEVVY